jgi:sec-independent protein translocase protein TatA
MFRNPYGDALVALLIVLLIFGPKRLPVLGRSLGQGLREFKDSISGKDSEADERPELEASSAAPVSSTPEREPATVSAPADPPPAAEQSEPRS